MNIKTYTVEHTPTYGEIKVEIDFDYVNDFGAGPVSMDGIIKDMVDFWDGSKDRLKDNNGNYLNTFLKQLCQRCMAFALEGNYNVNGVINKFMTEEGWLPMDGSGGIKLTWLDQMDISNQEDYSITRN